MKNHYKFYKNIVTGLAFLLLIMAAGCKNAIDVGVPVTKLSSANVFTSNTTAEAAVSGIFATMATSGRMYNGSGSLTALQGQAADELVTFSTTGAQFYVNSLTSQSNYYWTEIYLEMFDINAAIAGLTNATALNPAIRDQLLGEVKFARAFIYFYAVNLYGDVPMPLTTDYTANNVLSRTPVQLVYAQILQDLKDAQNLLPDNKYLSGTGAVSTDRVHPNKQAAQALMARVYLYQQDWVNAEAMATNVINASSYKLEAINSVFLKASQEAIWQLFPVSTGLNNADAVYLVVTTRPTTVSSQLPLNNALLNAFEVNDARLANWVGTYVAPAAPPLPATTYKFAYKYKVYLTNSAITEYPIMLRLAEQYLIRAEARAQQGNTSGAQSDLNAIRTRAGLPNTTATTKADLLTATLHERQVELFTEQGHRWFDLRRTGTIDAVMNVATPLKGGTWASTKQLVPLPASEIVLNSNLVQNPGY
ncbi:MAG: RagB/SusD family nutrient uptake outer membrane protein [Bacteroidota bacterium]